MKTTILSSAFALLAVVLGTGAQTAVTNIPPGVEIIGPLAGAVFPAPANLLIQARAYDRDGQVVSVEFFAGSNSLGVVLAPPVPPMSMGSTMPLPIISLMWSNVPVGAYDLTAVALDNAGATTRSRPVHVTVVERIDLPPIVHLVSPPNGSIFKAPATISLVASAMDPDGQVASVEFFAGSNSLGVVITPLPVATPAVVVSGGGTAPIPPLYYGLTWSNVPAGSYMLTAVATDDKGVKGRSEAVCVGVTDRTNPPPELTLVEIFAAKPYASEDTNNPSRTGLFVVRRTGPTNAGLTVPLKIGGTASNGVDYALIPDSVTLDAGQRETTIVIDPMDDTLVEGTETVIVGIVLPQPVATTTFPPVPPPYIAGAHLRATVFILDNDRPNFPPMVRLVKPFYGQRFPVGQAINLQAIAMDRDGSIASVAFYADGALLGTGTNPPPVTVSNAPSSGVSPVASSICILPIGGSYFLTWNGAAAGRHTLTARATDDKGASSASNPVMIFVGTTTVEPPPPPVPTNLVVRPSAPSGSVMVR